MTQEHVPSHAVGPTGASSPRLIVLQVTETESVKHIRVLETRIGAELNLQVRDDWVQSIIEPSHIIRVILVTPSGSYLPWSTLNYKSIPLIIDKCSNLLVLHSDTLVSGTAVSDSFRCLRKSVITARTPLLMGGDTIMGEAALFGSMIHDLFQNILVLDSNTRDYSTPAELSQKEGVDLMSFFEAVEIVIANHSDELFAASIPVVHARKVMHKVVPQIIEWYRVLMGSGNYQSTEGVLVPAGKALNNVIVTKVHDIEELVWSPALGLKGKIDASVHLRINGDDVGIAVLELKSGKANSYSAVSHSAQVSLYNLLLSDRKGAAVNHGLLTYIRYQEALKSVREDEQTGVGNGEPAQHADNRARPEEGVNHRLIAPSRSELVALIIQRNRLAAHLRIDTDIEDIPPLLLGNPDVCKMCYAVDNCLLQHKMVDGGTEKTAEEGPGRDLFRQKTLHLTEKHAEYYRFWRNVLADEEEHAGRGVPSIWGMKASRKELIGKCASDLVLVDPLDQESVSPHQLLAPGTRTVAEFQRHQQRPDGKNLLGCGLSIGEFVIISAERRRNTENNSCQTLEGCETWQSALTNGFIQILTKDKICVSVDRSLGAWARHQGVDIADIAWRIDGEEIFASHNTAKRTLDTLFYSEDTREGIARLRELVVDGVSPGFIRNAALKIRSDHSVITHLNDEQQKAVRMSLRARDYMLILGMPGTGKTATLATIVKVHALQGRSVLVCSHTNTAVDNVLRRLLSTGFEDFVRLGHTTNVVDQTIRPYHVSVLTDGASDWASVEQQVLTKHVVATTCLGIHHWVLQRRRKFDLVVVDEASQMIQPICIGPLQFANGPFVLVGDHYQLPPLQRATVGTGRRLTRSAMRMTRLMNVQAELNSHSSEESLFRRLCERHPDAMVLLSKQYRMAKDIMDLCNEMVYGGSLQCGNDQVASQCLQTKYRCIVNTDVNNIRDNWLESVSNPEQRVLLVDTGQKTIKNNGNIKTSVWTSENEAANHVEVEIVAKCALQLITDGVEAADISVLSPFRAQVEALKASLKQNESTRDCQVSTVDQYQGKDNVCVIVSLVRCGDTGVGALMRDWRRINVAMTRAKQKLIFVACVETVSKGGQFLRHFMEHLQSKGNVVRIGERQFSEK